MQDTATADIESATDLLSKPFSTLEAGELGSWPVESAESAEAHSSPVESVEVHSGLAKLGSLTPTSHPASSSWLALQQAALPLICLAAATVGLALLVRLLYRYILVTHERD